MTAAVKSIILQVFPRPRRTVTFATALPLVIFLAAYAAACLYLELANVMLFSRPTAFALGAPLPWLWWIHLSGATGLSGFRSVVALVVRLSVAGVLIMLLAEPRAVRTSDVLSVVYGLDLSDSIGEDAADRALTFVTRTATGKPEKDEAGLVVFGRNAAVELPPKAFFPFEAVNCRISRDGTNLEKGLSLAAAMLPDENQGRIVLITDGTQTEGNYSGILDELSSRDIPVDVLPIQYEYTNEVWLEKLELPRFVKSGETYEASIVLSSLSAGTGNLVLRENGREICSQRVDFSAGKNRYTLPLYLRDPGYYEYVATIEVRPRMDGWAENNNAINYLYLKGEGKVLLVTDPAGDNRDWDVLVKALKKAERAVEVTTPYEFHRDPLSLLPYDCVVFVNVSADNFDAVQLSAMRDAVFNQGTGFMMIGGKNSFGPGGYHRSPIEEALPVTMDITQRKVLPKGALAIVLHTCEFAQGNTWGKRVAKEAMKVLGAQDEVGVLVYDYQGREKWLFTLTPASEYEKLVKTINQAQIGDMPSFGTTMQMGLDGLKASDAASKHMIIISDGDPSPPTPALLKDFVANKISVSTVAVFPHGGTTTGILRAIAQNTGGRYYYPQDPNLLPAIFIKEAKTLKRSLIQNKTFVPAIEFPSPVLKGIEAFPQLRGYVLTSPKPRSTTILKGPDQEEVDPVLATWRFGLGKTAAFTSDLSPNWAAAWMPWELYRPFVKQLMTDISRVEKKSSLHLTAFASGSTGVILVEDHHAADSFLEIEARIGGPRRRTENVKLKQIGPRRYEGVFDLWGKGRYHVMAAAVGAGRTERILGGFVVPYSPEYLRFRSNPIVLNRIAERTGGRILTGDETGEALFSKDRRPRASSRSVADLFLLALAVLIPLDVGIRRIQLDIYVIRGWLGLDKKGAPSGETFKALLKRKQRIEFVHERPDDDGPPPVSQLPPRKPLTQKPAPKKPEPEKKIDEDRPLSTTERLLAKKKKWKEGEES